MATITPGSSGTINATTIEGQLWQLIHYINSLERGLALQRINTTKSDDFLLTGEFTMPASMAYNSSTGIYTATAAPYLPTAAFAAGTGGTVKGTTLSQYFIDTVNYIVNWQNTPAKNPNNLGNVTLSMDFNSLEYRGTVNLPYAISLGTSGTVTESATEWLIT
jgi:hypothetical protein